MKSSGTDAENRSKALMESRGYQVEKARAKVVWIKSRPISLPYDFFGAFDLICVTSGAYVGEKITLPSVVFIQVKSSKVKESYLHLAEARKKMNAVAAPNGSKLLHIWVKNEKGRWNVEEEVVA